MAELYHFLEMIIEIQINFNHLKTFKELAEKKSFCFCLLHTVHVKFDDTTDEDLAMIFTGITVILSVLLFTIILMLTWQICCYAIFHKWPEAETLIPITNI